MSYAYVSPEEVRSFLRVQTNAHDPEVDMAVDAAHRDVDRYCGWGVVDGFAQGDATATARTFPARHYLRLMLPTGFWTATDLVVKTDDDDDGTYEVTWASTDYKLLPSDNVYDGTTGFPFLEVVAVGDLVFPVQGVHPNRVQITAKWGWETVPADVKMATLLRASQLFARRETRDGIQPLTGFRAGGRDRDWELLLDGYRHPDLRHVGF